MYFIHQISPSCLIISFLLYSIGIIAQPDLEFYRYPTDQAPGTKIQAIFKDNFGYLWMGKPDGLLRHDGINFKTYIHDPRDSTTIRSNDIKSFYQDSQGQLWIGTKTGGICRYDYKTEKFDYFPLQTSHYPNSEDEVEGAWVFFEDSDKNIWAGTRFHGLQVLEKGARHFKGYLPNGEGNEVIGTRTIRSAIPVQNKPDHYWIGTLTALFEFDTKNRHFIKHEINAQRYKGEVASVYCITADTDSTLLTGGWGDGFVRYNFKQRSVDQFLYRDLLSSANIVFDIIKLNSHEVLLGTGDRALIHYNLNTRKHYWYAYDESRTNRSWRGETYDTHLDKSGRVWMAQTHGLATFRLYEDTLPPIQLPPCISSIRIDNEEVKTNSSLNFIHSLAVQPKQKIVSIELGDFNLEPDYTHEFQYKLSGLFDTWRTTNSHVIEFQNLAAGKRMLQLRSKTRTGDWSEIKKLEINVLLPFWKEWWFVAMCFLAFGSIIFGINRISISQIRKEESLKSQFQKQLNEVELNALRAQMNPHFLFNCLNSINKYIITNKPQEASEYLTKFSWLMRLILQNSKNKFVSLEDELETLDIYIQLEQQRFEGKFQYKITSPKDHSLTTTKIPPLLLQPYVENAIWHGLMHKEGRGNLNIDLSLESGNLICIIEDDGIGRKKSAEINAQKPSRKKSMGTDITRSRLELIKKLYQIEANVIIEDLHHDSGTRVTIVLPQEN